MATKGKAMGKAKPALEKVVHGRIMKTNIAAGMASAAPPLGTMLGQRGLNIANFVKDFNEQTANHKEGIPLPTRVHLQGDRSYILEIMRPPVSFLLKQAAGIRRGSMEPGRTTVGVVSIKHVYEIAKFKIQDIYCAQFSLREMCIRVLNVANMDGIKVVKHDLDANELREFLAKRAEIEKAEIASLAEKKAARMMKASATAAAAAAAAKTKK